MWKWAVAAFAFVVIVIAALAVGFGKRRVHRSSSSASGASSNGTEPSVSVDAPVRSPSGTAANLSVVSPPAPAAPPPNASSQVPDAMKEPTVYAFEVVKTYPHDLAAFTEGLVYAGNDTFYESTGLYGHSSIRLAELHTGKVRQQRNMDSQWFGEGLTLFGGKLWQLVYKFNYGFVYDPVTLDVVGNFTTTMSDGWGLTHDGANLIGSDGTAFIYFFDPADFRETKRLRVTDAGFGVHQINELEYINGEIWANIWLTDCIARISPETGRVLGWMHLPDLKMSALSNAAARADGDKVLNGIAYDVESDRIFVTGKKWPLLFEIKVRGLTSNEMNNANSLAAVRKACHL
ncbi:hypothetical protein CBR_g727 [Chara braunii]|uniref:Glutamine cyclotransferase n=1 Tax=Chara braunii TaxID=69332 RepID=A0A388KC14_CHABU|nr:hypothetical protein CBR_g727 [Chara braunii]|eukprot:GBG67598.1 hypothetical protein CBR_g727 [Chara braunii]